MHSVTDRRTDGQIDGQQDDANSRSYCVAVRSANEKLQILGRPTPIRFVDPSAVNLEKSCKPHNAEKLQVIDNFCGRSYAAIGVVLSSVLLSVCDAVHCGLRVGVQS